jgi:hypothetical protein
MALTLPKICRPSRSPQAPSPEPLSPGGGWGYFQNLPSSHVEEPPTAPVIPTSLSNRSKKALSNMSGGVSSPSKYHTPSQTPHTTGAGSRNKRPPSTTTSSDEEVSSGMSSDSGMTTPPVQVRRALTPIYGPVGLPTTVPGTGNIAPVPLPTHNSGTGGMNPANSSPMQSQQSQNPDGLPPPGMVNEPPAPTTNAGSGRGRGTAGRGRKRK